MDELTSALSENLTEMERLLAGVRASLQAGYRRRRRVLFLPWRGECWKSVESVWKAAMEDPEYEVFIMPVTWFYRDHMLEPREDEPQFDAEGFPDYVKLSAFWKYPLEELRPDLIIFNNPYDECNYTTMVDPRFFSRELKGLTDHLVYIPWFVTDEIDAVGAPDDQAVYNMRYYVTVPGVVHADYVIVQSELMRASYIHVLTEMSGEEYRPVWEKKIQAFGSPLLEERPDGSGYDSIPASPIWEKLKALLDTDTRREAV